MNLRDLKYLVTLADEGHFYAAAKKCFVSQPGLSLQIKKLEEELGVQLLERGNKSLLITEPGKEIVAIARMILQQAEQLKQVAKEAHDPFSGKIILGVIPTIAAYLLPDMIPHLKQAFPKLTLYLIEEKTEVLLQKLENAEIDIALLALPVKGNMVSHALFHEEFYLAVSSSHELAQNKTVSAQDVAEQEVLLLAEGHCLRDQALSFCEKLNLSENQDFRATSLETLKNMVAAGAGMTLVPKMACLPMSGIVYIPFEKQKPLRTVGLVWRNSSARDKLCGEIFKVLKERRTGN